ncbi:MAG: sulfatase-like hydrolase/transferase [bacterium]|nr:sulfatase-like hydrolase/transferase [bacterium]
MKTKTHYRSLQLICVCIALLPSTTTPAGERTPNIVVLLSDDLGWKDIGCYDGPVKTPTLDRLASGGMRFTNFYSGAAVCSPSRAALLTGRTNVRASIYSWINDHDQRSHLPKAEVTIAEVLQRGGYATAHFGKWHLGLPSNKFPNKPTPAEHGFDYWFATGSNAQPSHHNPRNFIRNGKALGTLEGYACDLVVNEAISWLENRPDDDRPFFLNVWFHEPHAPLAAPDHLVGEYGEQSDLAAVYSATIANTDQAISRLVEKLHRIDKPENTLIIYSSDNGSYRADRVGILRGTKGSNYEGGIRVPGIFYWPSQVAAGTVEGEPAGLVDLLPTICGVTGIAPPPVHLDGADISPLLYSFHPPSGRVEEEERRRGEGKKRNTQPSPAATASDPPGGRVKENSNATFKRSQALFSYLPLSGPTVAIRDGRFNMVAYRDGRLPKDYAALAEIKTRIETLLREKGIFDDETRSFTFEKQLFEGFRDSEAERLRGRFIRLNQFHEAWIPGLKQSQFTRFELYDLKADPSQKTNIAVREPVIHAKMKAQLLKLAKSASDDAFDWSSVRPAPSREPTAHVHRFASDYRSPFDAFVYMNRIPIEVEALEDQAGLASRIESRLANQEGRVQIKLPPTMKRDAYEGFKLAAGIGTGSESCFTCHHLPALGHVHRDLSVPTLRNRTYTRKQLSKSLDSEAHKEVSIDGPTVDRMLAFLRTLSNMPDTEFRPLILNATVLDTTGDIE